MTGQELLQPVPAVVPPLPALAQAAAGKGVLASYADPDAVVRRTALLVPGGPGQGRSKATPRPKYDSAT